MRLSVPHPAPSSAADAPETPLQAAADLDAREIANTASEAPHAPILTVAAPFYRDDPSALLDALGAQLTKEVEVLLHDDGSSDADLAERVAARVLALPTPARLRIGALNRGRAGARNALARAARAPMVLFLDADMTPAAPDFLARWRAEAAVAPEAITFGGFAPAPVADRPDARLHAALAARSDAPDAATRARDGARHVTTCNLLVPTALLAAEPFDEGYRGWGWEDVDFAVRAAARAPVRHIDNPAVHGGLLSDTALLERYAASGANFARFLARAGAVAEDFPIARAARLCARLPVTDALRPLLRAIALARRLPPPLRLIALKAWRASWYGEALR